MELATSNPSDLIALEESDFPWQAPSLIYSVPSHIYNKLILEAKGPYVTAGMDLKLKGYRVDMPTKDLIPFSRSSRNLTEHYRNTLGHA
jgi:hypothetical protein